MSVFVKSLMLFAAVVLLSGCAAIDDFIARVWPAPAVTIERPAEPAQSANLPSAVVVAKLRPLPYKAAEVSPPPSQPESDPQQLLLLDLAAAKMLLGTPVLETELPPAKLITYNGAGCVLNIFFYPKVEGQTYQALTYEFVGPDKTTVFARQCFAKMLAKNTTVSTNPLN